jgi:hypothetical protein
LDEHGWISLSFSLGGRNSGVIALNYKAKNLAGQFTKWFSQNMINNHPRKLGLRPV